ncbi:MAG: helix-turn-helix transcriptional regulator [Candidatus Paceibacterota bacterium]
MEVSNCVARLRQGRQETQEELALSVGVTRQTIISIEKGRYMPSISLALKLAKHFKVSVEDIFKLQ